ncbi:hypothetical protein Tco_0496653 [Tanacetum coccineum]
MLAPSGEGLILYQAYRNLYAMIGRKAHLLDDKQIPSVGVFDEVFRTWMALGGNTHDLGSFGEETDEITDLHHDSPRIMFLERGDGVTSTKRRPRDLFGDGVRDLATANVLHDIASNLRMEYLPKRRWSERDKLRSYIMIKKIDKQLYKRRLIRNLEKFIGGKEYKEDFRLLKRTI